MTKKLTITGVMLALATILSMIRLFDAPYGGSVTLCSMLPVIVPGLLYGMRWGILTGTVYAVLNMLLTGIPSPPVASVGAYILVVLLDYILAFGGLGLAGGFFRLFPQKPYSVPVAVGIAILFRFVCHFLSGIIIWGTYAGEGQSVAVYSLLYNGGYMLFEFIITVALSGCIARWLMREKL